jgi:urocanate hydratase
MHNNSTYYNLHTRFYNTGTILWVAIRSPKEGNVFLINIGNSGKFEFNWVVRSGRQYDMTKVEEVMRELFEHYMKYGESRPLFGWIDVRYRLDILESIVECNSDGIGRLFHWETFKEREQDLLKSLGNQLVRPNARSSSN